MVCVLSYKKPLVLGAFRPAREVKEYAQATR